MYCALQEKSIIIIIIIIVVSFLDRVMSHLKLLFLCTLYLNEICLTIPNQEESFNEHVDDWLAPFFIVTMKRSSGLGFR